MRKFYFWHHLFCGGITLQVTACSTNYNGVAAIQDIEKNTKPQANTGNPGPKLLPSTNGNLKGFKNE